MLRHLLFALPLLLAVPDLSVIWKGGGDDRIKIVVDAESDVLDRCLASGLEVRYRYELQLCRRRQLWFHACKDQRLILHAMQFDPITESYEVRRDRHGDDLDEEVVTVDNRDEARNRVSRVEDLSLEYLSQGDAKFWQNQDAYIGMRVFGECRGEYSELIAKIGYFITFGLVKVSAFSSGWIDFDLNQKSADNPG